MHAGLGIGSSFPSSLQTNPFGSYAVSPYGFGQQQWLQAVPQQIYQLQQLAQLQHQQLQQLLQIVQVVPQQLQQLLHIVAQQPFGAAQPGIGPIAQPQAFGAPFQGFSPYSVPFAGSGNVM